MRRPAPQLVQERLRPLLRAGVLVLLDRFVDSSLAYQGAGRELGIERGPRDQPLRHRRPVPDRTLLLRIAPRRPRAPAARAQPSPTAWSARTSASSSASPPPTTSSPSRARADPRDRRDPRPSACSRRAGGDRGPADARIGGSRPCLVATMPGAGARRASAPGRDAPALARRRASADAATAQGPTPRPRPTRARTRRPRCADLPTPPRPGPVARRHRRRHHDHPTSTTSTTHRPARSCRAPPRPRPPSPRGTGAPTTLGIARAHSAASGTGHVSTGPSRSPRSPPCCCSPAPRLGARALARCEPHWLHLDCALAGRGQLRTSRPPGRNSPTGPGSAARPLRARGL